jgi:hypothetical protein
MSLARLEHGNLLRKGLLEKSAKGGSEFAASLSLLQTSEATRKAISSRLHSFKHRLDLIAHLRRRQPFALYFRNLHVRFLMTSAGGPAARTDAGSAATERQSQIKHVSFSYTYLSFVCHFEKLALPV